MPSQTEYGQLEICVTAKSPFGLRSVEKDIGLQDIKEKFSKLVSKHEVSKKEVPTHGTDEQNAAKLKLPNLAASIKNSGKKDLQVFLRGFQCFDSPSHGVKQMHNSGEKHLANSPRPMNLKSPAESRNDVTEGTSCLSDKPGDDSQSNSNNSNDIVLPLSVSILEGRRVNLREKDAINKQRIGERRSKQSCHHDSGCEESDFERIFNKSRHTGRKTSDANSSRQGKRDARPVFHLPKADKYDITPRNIINSKVCSVFKINRRRSSGLYSVYRDNYSPRRDSYAIKNSVYKTITQQPAVFLRQPSPVAGVKMTIQEQEDKLVAAIQAVEECNERIPSVVAEVTRQVKKFVIKLPPIC